MLLKESINVCKMMLEKGELYKEMGIAGPRFGVAGFPPNFFSSAFGKRRENIFAWLDSIELDWIELQNTYGVKMKPDQAHLYRDLAEQYGIGVSLHGPYYISLASNDADVLSRSRERILQCVHLAEEIHANRIIFHPGYGPGKSKDDRRSGIHQIIRELNALKNDIPKGIYLYPETAGKVSQLGSIEEILEICESVEFARPCLDLAHIHGFERGCLWTGSAIASVFELVKHRFGGDYLKNVHIHMYPVDFDNNGEKKHKAFGDRIENVQLSLETEDLPDRYYPRAEDFVSAIKELNISPVVVCEARDTQDEGARLMKDLYYDMK